MFGLTTSQVFALLGVALAVVLWRLAKLEGVAGPLGTAESAVRAPVAREA